MKTRRIIALFFAIGFLISAPALILYTAGYRYNIKKQELSKYGTLVIKSTPRNATVILNNDQKTFRTPLRKDDLFPNSYLITVAKDGYHSWQKRLSIYPQQTTFAENIILFENNEPTKILDQSIKQAFVTPDKNQLLLTYNKSNQTFLALLNLADNQLRDIEKITWDKIKSIDWSHNANLALVTFEAEVNPETYLYDLKNLKRLKKIITNARWSNESDDTIYYLKDNVVSIEKISDKSVETLHTFESGIVPRDFYVNGSRLYFISQSGEGQTLNYLELNNNEAERSHKIDLGKDNFIVSDFIGNYLVIKNISNKHLVFVNSDLDNILLEEPEVIGYKMNTRENSILLYDSSEISLADLRVTPTKISTSVRVTSGITWADWYTEPNYLVYIENQNLKITELDDRDTRNTINLATGAVNFATINKKGTEIIFTKPDEPGLFTIKIAE